MSGMTAMLKGAIRMGNIRFRIFVKINTTIKSPPELIAGTSCKLPGIITQGMIFDYLAHDRQGKHPPPGGK